MLCLQVFHLALVLLLLVLEGLATRLSQLGMVALGCRQFSLQVRHGYSHLAHLFLYLSIVLTTFQRFLPDYDTFLGLLNGFNRLPEFICQLYNHGILFF